MSRFLRGDRYDDPAGERGSRTIVEWVDAAQDETLPLKGARQ
jgi:hypothetical protein